MRDLSGVTIRPLNPADEPFIFRLFTGGRIDDEWAAGLGKEQGTELFRQKFRCQHNQLRKDYPDADFGIIILDGLPLGRLYVHRGETVITVLAITLLPEYRGRGIGSGLLKGILADASRTGRPVRIQVAWHNYKARALYERLGFRRTLEKVGIYCEMQWTPGQK